jgi:hypothetical protein
MSVRDRERLKEAGDTSATPPTPPRSDTGDTLAEVCLGAGIGAGAVVLLSIGVIPRVGLIRAITLGWKSYFKTVHPLSARSGDVKRLREAADSMRKGSYISVVEPDGSGKSCLVDTALHRHFGVVKLWVSCGA